MGSTRATDSTTVTGLAVRGFTRQYGRAPGVVWSAPGRVNLIGEHTDYNDGFVLPFAIAQRTAVAAARRGDDTIVVNSTSYPGGVAVIGLDHLVPGKVTGWAAYPLGVRGRPPPESTCSSPPRFRSAAGFPPRPRWRWRWPERWPTCGALS